jgi:hypothetical protein
VFLQKYYKVKKGIDIRIKMHALLLLVFIASTAVKSQPKTEFSAKLHDFGKIAEAEGKKSFTFYVSNKGNQPLVIQRIEASCGCTTPEFTKTPIPPGGKGVITAIFDPENRSGIFSKTLTVYTNSTPAAVVLTLKGEVVARERKVEESFLWPVGPVRFQSREIAFQGFPKTQKKVRIMQLINTSNEQVKVEFTDLPSHLLLKCVPESLKPGQKGVAECTYAGMKDNRWGPVSDMIRVKLNGIVQETGIYVSANLLEDFSDLTREEIANAPVFKPVNARFDFGQIDPSAPKNAEFIIRNEGKRELIIRDVKPYCDCASVIRGAGITIKPGGTGTVVVSFNPGGLSGDVTRQVFVCSNDPKNSQAILIFHANVVKGNSQVKK